MLTMPPLTEDQAQDEFIEKLKRKSSISASPTTPTPPVVSSNLRTLTEVKMNAGEGDMDMDISDGEMAAKEEGPPKNNEKDTKNNKTEEENNSEEDSEMEDSGPNRGPSSVIVQPIKNREPGGGDAWHRGGDRDGRMSPRSHRDSGGDSRYERDAPMREREPYRDGPPPRYSNRDYSSHGRGRDYDDYPHDNNRREPGRPDPQRRPSPRDMFYRDPYTGRMRPNFPLPPPPPPVNNPRRGYYPRY
jgi:hypothetical protein